MAGFWDRVASAARDLVDGGDFTWGRGSSRAVSSREPVPQNQRPGFRAPASPEVRPAPRPVQSAPPPAPASSSAPVRVQGPTGGTVTITPNRQRTVVNEMPERQAEAPTEERTVEVAGQRRTIETNRQPELARSGGRTPIEEDEARAERSAAAADALERRRVRFDRIVGSGRVERARELTPEEYAALNPRQRAAVDFNTELMATRRGDVDRISERVNAFLAERGMEGADATSYERLDAALSDAIVRQLGDTERVNRLGVGDTPRPNTVPEGQLRLRDAANTASQQANLAVNRASMAATDPNAQALDSLFNTMIDRRGNYTTQDVVEGLGQLNASAGTNITTDQLWSYAARRLRAADQARVARVDFSLSTDPEVEPLDIADIRKRYGL